MATYIQGLTDYIPQIQPFKPDYNFLANVLQTRQSRYDSSYKQISGLYTSLFNSPMLKDVNIKRKEEFFKAINQDIKKASGLDLSLQQNADKALKVFQPFYDDKDMVNDMVKTKQIHNAMAKGDSFKNCTDPEKCGGQYWEPGMQKLYYKIDEFKKTDDKGALDFQMPDFDPYYNWKKDAIKLAKEADLNVTQDFNTGQWIVKKQNGDLVKGGLYSLFSTAYGDDPRVNANYNTEAYVQRKSFASNNVDKYGSEDAAERAYITETINSQSKKSKEMWDEFQGHSSEVNEKVNADKEKEKNEGTTPDEKDKIQDLLDVKNGIDKSTKALEEVHNSINNNADNTDINILRSRADAAAAFGLKNKDLMDMASTMSLRNAKSELSANPYALATHNSQLSLSNQMNMAGINYQYALGKISAQHFADIDMYNIENGITSGAIAESPIALDHEQYALDPTGQKNISAGSDSNRDAMLELTAETKQGANQFLLSAILTAKASNKVSGINYLNKTFGSAWVNIHNAEDLQNYLTKNNKSPVALYESTVNALNQDKNPTADLKWANAFMNGNGALIQNINQNNQASKLVSAHISNANKTIVSNLQKMVSTENPEYKDADLLLTSSGFLDSKESFIKKFTQRYAGHNFRANPADVYDKISDKFNTTYTNTKGVVLDQGFNNIGVGAGGMYQAKALQYNRITPLEPQNPGRINLIGILTDLNNNKENVHGTIGKATATNIANSDPNLVNFLPQFLNDMTKWNGSKANAPVVNYIETPIAGNNKNMSAVTIFANQQYLDEYIGTNKNKKILYPYKDQLANGITLFYNNNEVKTPTQNALKVDPLLLTVKLEGIDYTAFPKAGDGHARYDNSTGKVIFTENVVKYDENTHKKYTEPTAKYITLEGYRTFHDAKIKEMQSRQNAVIEIEKEIAAYYKNK